MTDLTDVSTHYKFGRNWRRFADTIDASKLQNATTSLHRLAPIDELRGKAMLDVGCGSGLQALAVLLSGSKKRRSFDLDSDSVATTTALLEKFAPQDNSWAAEVRSVFEFKDVPCFEIVYSRGACTTQGRCGARSAARPIVSQAEAFFTLRFIERHRSAASVGPKNGYTHAPRQQHARLSKPLTPQLNARPCS